jgi:hypothetical protein
LSHKGIELGQEGFMALIEMFAKGHFTYLSEFRLNNFEPQATPLLAFVEASLVSNQSLHTIGFSKNRLNEDICAAIMQRIYFNPTLTTLDISNNNVTIGSFSINFVKKYFNTRRNFTIIYD